MPTETAYHLVVQGPSGAIERFRGDHRLWQAEPWSGMFGLPVVTAEPNRLTYLYRDDYKRPAPSIASMAAAHPALAFTLERCDELGTIARRVRYVDGREADSEDVHPEDLAWIEWEWEGD